MIEPSDSPGPEAGAVPAPGTESGRAVQSARTSPSARDEAILDLAAAAALVEDGMTVGLSGFAHQNPPMAVVRELVRRRVRGLTVVSGPTSGIETDLLIGAGCVSRVVTAGVALEGVTGIAPAFRHSAERGEIEVWECDECIWYVALKAAAWGVPWLLWPGGVGTSLPELNTELEEVEVDGRRFLRVPAVQPDIVFVHAAEADRFGNVRDSPKAYLGRSFAEVALTEACAGPVIATVEKIVDNADVVAAPEWTRLWGAQVVVAPGGAHPGGVNGHTAPDLDELSAYAHAGSRMLGGDRAPYEAYVADFVAVGRTS